MNIVLIGYRGTGKSHIGSLLGKSLGMPVVSMDEEIVKSAGMSIPEIVETYDWPKFRDMETAEARKLAGKDGLVIDCGGGVIERDENVEILQQNAMVFWLKASVETVVKRIESSGTERPALTEGKSFTDEVAEVLERRTPLYRNAAHHEIDTDFLNPEQVVKQITELWQQR